jgi:hypothetical protein
MRFEGTWVVLLVLAVLLPAVIDWGSGGRFWGGRKR